MLWITRPLLIFSYILCIKGQLGDLYLIAFCSNVTWPDVVLKLTSLSSRTIQVSVKKLTDEIDSFEVSKSTPTEHIFSARQIVFYRNITIVLQGSGPFGASLFVASNGSMASCLLLPVNYWGSWYFFSNIRKSPIFVTVVSNAEYSHIRSLELQEFNRRLRRFEIIEKLILNPLHCYGIYGNDSFGLIVGSPAATSFAYNCNTARRGKANSTDFLLDMLSPSEASGKTFVILKPLRKLTPAIGLVIIINVAIAKNSFNVTKESVTSKDIELKEIECKELEGYAKGPLVIRSKLAVYVVLIQPSTCVQYDTVAELDGDASMTTIVPVELFFDIYVWSTPGLGKIVIKHYMTLIVPKNMETLIVLNERPLDELTQTEKETISSWDLVGIPLDAGIYELYSTPVIYFGCYVYGYAKGSGYMQVAGYMNGRLYDNRNRICEKSAPKPGDLLDNDCDGKIDEEINNNLDDDGDSQIDEDLAKPNRINGAWTEWSAWTCSTDCKDHKMYRSRDCTNPAPQNEGNPCEGEEKEAKESDCYRNKLCPKDCGPGFWGEDCKFLCQNCEPDCEKFTGQCSNCKAGYKRPKERCNVGCEENEYGPNCLNNCTHKCGEDCADRIHGFCAKNILLYAPLMLILFLTPYVLLFCLRSRDRKIQKEEGEQKSKLVAIHETKSGSSEDSD